MNRLLPPPTPQDIEAALTEIRNGTNVYGRWILLCDDMKNQDEAIAEAARLWWVNIINPEGVEETACGGGITSTEAAAVTWITTCLGAWWREPGLSEEDDAKVPRHVPDGFQFELHAVPVRPALKVIEGSRDLLKSDKAIPSLKSALLAERNKSASDEDFLEHLHGLLQEIIPNFSATLTYEE